MMALSFNISRNNSAAQATDFDLGDLEFGLDGVTISSCSNPRLSSMIFISMSALIDGLLKIETSAKKYKFVGVDSSFVIIFEKSKDGIYIKYGPKTHGPVSLRNLLEAIHEGIERFTAEPCNRLREGTAAYTDFNESWRDLKVWLS